MERVQDIRMESNYSPPRPEKSKEEEAAHFGDIFSLKMQEEPSVAPRVGPEAAEPENEPGKTKKSRKKQVPGLLPGGEALTEIQLGKMPATPGSVSGGKGSSRAASLSGKTGRPGKPEGLKKGTQPGEMQRVLEKLLAKGRRGFQITVSTGKQLQSGGVNPAQVAGKVQAAAAQPTPAEQQEFPLPPRGETETNTAEKLPSGTEWKPGKAVSNEMLNWLKLSGKDKTLSQAERMVLQKGAVPDAGAKNTGQSASGGFDFQQGGQKSVLKQTRTVRNASANPLRHSGTVHFTGENLTSSSAPTTVASAGQAAANPGNATLYATITQVIQTYFRSRNGLESKTQFRIRSKEFGQLSIQFSKEGAADRVTIVVQNAAVKDYMEKFVPLILDGLAQQNIAVEDLAVEVGHFGENPRQAAPDSSQQTSREPHELLTDLSAALPRARSIRYFGYNTIEVVI